MGQVAEEIKVYQNTARTLNVIGKAGKELNVDHSRGYNLKVIGQVPENLMQNTLQQTI